MARAAVVGLLVFLASFWLRLDGLDLVATADEGYWMQRTLRFGAALARGDLASTFRAGHPGVTVMWTGLAGIGPDRLEPFLPERYIRFEPLEQATGYLEAFSAARRAVAVVTSFLVAGAVLLAWRLFGGGPALAGGLLLVFDPYAIGMTRLLHVEAFLAPLMTVSALAGLAFWTQGARWPYLLLSAVAGGLALLTKAPAGLLPIFFGLVCVVSAVWGWRGVRPALRAIVPLLVWGLVAVGVYLLLFPALWLDPLWRVQQLIEFTAQTGLQPHDGNFFLGRPTLDDPGPLYYAVTLPLRMSPLVMLGLALLVLPSSESRSSSSVRWLLAYAILFVVLMTLASKKFDRYMLPALLAFDLLAGVGLWRLAVTIAGKVRRAEAKLAVVLAGLLAAGQIVVLALARPYPIAYYNPVAGGSERAHQLLMVGWGEGLEQVAAYLNGLPDAEQLYVVSSYNHVLRPKFVGTTLPLSPYLRPTPGQTLPTPDYVVLYVNGRQRRQIVPALERSDIMEQPAFVARVNGQEYAWVYRIPQVGPRPAIPVPAEEEGETQEN